MKKKIIDINPQIASVSHGSLTIRQATIKRKAKELNLKTVEVRLGEIEGLHEEVETLLNALNLNWGGYTTGYGTLIVRKGYEVDPHDFNSVYSHHHY
jgi:hypothetical protein